MTARMAGHSTVRSWRQLPRIRVQGNKFVDPEGKTVLFHGVSIADPDKLEHEGHWNKHLFEEVKDMGATLVRIPVHPIAWRQRTPGSISNCSTRR